MKLIKDLELGFSDAENYRRRENKSLLNRVFILITISTVCVILQSHF